MIKIEIGNERKVKKKYLKMVKPAVEHRLSILRTSLKHLNSGLASETEDNFDSYKFVTLKLANMVAATPFIKSTFMTGYYKNTVEAYCANPANLLGNINIPKLFDLLDDLLKGGAIELDDLLLCAPDNLKKKNQALIKKYKVGKLELEALKLGFNYKKVSKKIRKFFGKKNFVLHCPYCNVGEADHSPTPEGKTATSHHLDHFHDQSRSPLLSFSLFNLVPSDTGCNSTFNKGTIQFNDNYHLNPYSAGFNRNRMLFEPEMAKVGQPLKGVYLNVIPAHGTPLYKQLAGNGKRIVESSKRGNINVFALKTKYNKPELRKTAGDKIEKFYDLVSSRESLSRYLTRMGLLHNEVNYKDWYKKEIGTYFNVEDFHKNAYSKLFRDLHDDVLKKDISNINNDLRIIADLPII